VKEEVRLGNLKKTRKKSFDNFELIPEKARTNETTEGSIVQNRLLASQKKL
jgi:hypothetical protein